MKVSQLDQMKQAYEEALCIVQSNSQRVDAMKQVHARVSLSPSRSIAPLQKHVDFLRRMEPLEGQVKKIEIRRESESKKHALEAELLSAQAAHQQQVNRHFNIHRFVTLLCRSSRIFKSKWIKPNESKTPSKRA